jgi:hypothetical protein
MQVAAFLLYSPAWRYKQKLTDQQKIVSQVISYELSIIRKIDLRDPTQSTLLHEFIDNTVSNEWFTWITVLANGSVATVCDNYSMITSSWCNWTEH